MPSPRAIVFTHLGYVNPNELANPNRDAHKRLDDFFTKYFECKSEVGLVYIYIDHCVKRLLRNLRRHAAKGIFAPNQNLHDEDAELTNLVRKKEREKRVEAGLKPGEGPGFEIIGLHELRTLLDGLHQINPNLLDLLHGAKGIFTYDSPKFVESIVRIARGTTPHLAADPVIRIDADVTPSAPSIAALLREYQLLDASENFYFFSGGYRSVETHIDWLNDFAVRTHWLLPVGTVPAQQNPEGWLLTRTFLTDLTELGAAQILAVEPKYSTGMQNIMLSPARRKARGKFHPRSVQVISGAGLVMSPRAIIKLPPFMNFSNMTIWTDDYLKRRLHEAIKQVKSSSLERCADATFSQDRHGPTGPQNGDLVDARSHYLDRLVRGCLFCRLISNLDGTATIYSEAIGRAVRVPGSDQKLTDEQWESLKSEILIRLQEIISAWSSGEYVGKVNHKWALEKMATKEKFSEALWKSIKLDAETYLNLTNKWQIFVGALLELSQLRCPWLFTKVLPFDVSPNHVDPRRGI